MSPIHDQSYRRYGGTKRPLGQSWQVIAGAGIRSFLSRKLFLAVLLVAWIPFIARTVHLYFVTMYPVAGQLLPVDAKYFMQFIDQQSFFVFMVTVFVGSGLIAADRRANALQVYLSKPLMRIEYIAGKMDGKGKLGVITGYFGATQHTQRMNGALDYLKANFPDIQIIGPFENKDKAETAYSLVQDMVTANPDLSMVYVTAGGPFGAAKAVKDLKLTGKVGVVGFDHTPDNMQYLKSGEMVGLLDQAPYQQALDSSVMLYNYLVAGQEPPAKVIPVTGKLRTPDDAE